MCSSQQKIVAFHKAKAGVHFCYTFLRKANFKQEKVCE
jgi:hypothetical protein